MSVEDEVRSVFRGPMSGRSDFLFQYLQPTGGGLKMLGIPSVSSTFCWTAQTVARLGNSKQPIYIMAIDSLACSMEFEVIILIICIIILSLSKLFKCKRYNVELSKYDIISIRTNVSRYQICMPLEVKHDLARKVTTTRGGFFDT